MKVVVVGGGVIGLAAAHYLTNLGAEVTVVDAGRMGDGCSHGDAGARDHTLQVGLDEAWSHTWPMIREHTQHPDHAEGPRASLARRAPRWEPYVGH